MSSPMDSQVTSGGSPTHRVPLRRWPGFLLNIYFSCKTFSLSGAAVLYRCMAGWVSSQKQLQAHGAHGYRSCKGLQPETRSSGKRHILPAIANEAGPANPYWIQTDYDHLDDNDNFAEPPRRRMFNIGNPNFENTLQQDEAWERMATLVLRLNVMTNVTRLLKQALFLLKSPEWYERASCRRTPGLATPRDEAGMELLRN